MPRSILEAIRKLHPDGPVLPGPIVKTLRWLEANGHVEQIENRLYAGLYPSFANAANQTWAAFVADPELLGRWLESVSVAQRNRLLPLVLTGESDGGCAAIWRDNRDESRFVHMGSVWIGTITKDPVDFLRFLAIGYPSPDYIDEFDRTPLQALLDADGFENIEQAEALTDGEYAPLLLPQEFRRFVETTFETTIPHTANALFPQPTDILDEEPDDDFYRWLSPLLPD